ncbi:hypothetical protein GGF41_006913 [Coemansia sp. RSA 2531]|nr:hypothetical protein GGF41_006913 [Coemansia sp. RSA 2531]
MIRYVLSHAPLASSLHHTLARLGAGPSSPASVGLAEEMTARSVLVRVNACTSAARELELRARFERSPLSWSTSPRAEMS